VRARAAAVARHLLWRLVLALTGGLTVLGSLPRGGCVVVANHSSHADTAALLAALDARHAPRVAAAADYWFAGGWRPAVCRALAAAFPVRRTGGGNTDMAAAVALLRVGRSVVVYPEGTRGGGAPARFHSGAFRLAAAAGVPVVPVGIAGTADLLPKHGRLRRGRVTVRIGPPVRADADAAREAVVRLAGGGRRPGPARCDHDGVSAPPEQPSGAVFRMSPLVVLVALALAVCVTPVASAGPYLWLLFLVPVGVIVWTLRVRTVADPDAVTVRRVVGGRRVPWTDITSVQVGRARNPATARISAVLQDGSTVTLPTVHVRDLPRLAAVSGGRLPDPTAGPQNAGPDTASGTASDTADGA
jgi:1-acyl-sn-glycerol-3-phosphate acyltransferase